MQSKNTFLRRAAAAIAALFILSFAGCGQTPIDSGSLPVSGVVSESPVSDSEQTAGVTEDGSFTIHFIDVGQADSALVTCDGHSMLIDGGNAQNVHKDEAKMFDCGWLNWVPTPGTELAHKFDLLRDSGKGRIFMDIDMPIADQSVTVQSYGGNLVRQLVKDTFGYDISYYRHLD